MARLASKQIAGYYPSPKTLLNSFASILRFDQAPKHFVAIDPCAGDGEAIQTLTDLWWEDYKPENLDDLRWYDKPESPSILACELEGDRGRELSCRLESVEHSAVFKGDAFRLMPTEHPDTGATVLYLNPPYDTDPEYGRLEHRFLERFTKHLYPGEGILFYLVPHRSLTTSADYLSRHYDVHDIWRLPDEHFKVFGQVLLVARRRIKPLPTNKVYREAIETSAEDPYQLAELAEICSTPLTISADVRYAQGYKMETFDAVGALQAFRPMAEEPVGVGHTAEEILGPKFTTAVPPKPAHIALALSSGMFNGKELQPNDNHRYPPVLAKGVFGRTMVEIDQKTNKDGEVTGSVQIERPHLKLTILRLDTFEFHELRSGTIATGSDDLSQWNSADLIRNYDRALAVQLDRQFPAIHDPRDDDREIVLPELARKPFQAQSHAIQAALKLLACGRNPFIVAEVGTGKSTIALFIAAALSPTHHDATSAQLEEIGLTRQLPRVKRTLVLAPPHLMTSWSDQAEAVDPNLRVQIVTCRSDVEKEADIYVLSRETAKLGHGYRASTAFARVAAPRSSSPRRRTPPAASAARRSRALRRTTPPDAPKISPRSSPARRRATRSFIRFFVLESSAVASRRIPSRVRSTAGRFSISSFGFTR